MTDESTPNDVLAQGAERTGAVITTASEVLTTRVAKYQQLVAELQSTKDRLGAPNAVRFSSDSITDQQKKHFGDCVPAWVLRAPVVIRGATQVVKGSDTRYEIQNTRYVIITEGPDADVYQLTFQKKMVQKLVSKGILNWQ